MMGRSHMAIGAASGFATAPSMETAWIAAGVAAYGALWPDVDTTSSKMGRALMPFSWFFSLFVEHRGATHSLIGTGIAAAIVYGLWVILQQAFGIYLNPYIPIAFMVGYASHILADMLTNSGVQLLWPLKGRNRIANLASTGGVMETIVVATLTIGIVIVRLEWL